MSKTNKSGTPWYRATHDAWCVWHGGRQVRLAKGKGGKAEAYARYAALLGAAPPPRPPGSPAADRLVADFLAGARETVTAATHSAYGCVLRAFVKAFGTRGAAGLRAEEVEAWAAARRWSQSTRRYALTLVAGVWRWAARGGLLPANPLRSLRRPRGRSRGAEVLIPPDVHERILGVASPEFADFLRAVHGTGARPGEVARVEAKDVAWDASCWVLAEHKTARKTGRPRTIHLPPAVLEVCRRLAGRHPTGPLFRTTRGRAWRKTAWRQAMARAQRKLGLAARPMVSGYRHGFATDALAQGVPDAQVAELLGHSDTSMIHRHYGHLSARSRELKEALARVRP